MVPAADAEWLETVARDRGHRGIGNAARLLSTGGWREATR
jgi:hypothetical protein